MNSTNHLHSGSKTEAQDELADEPPIRKLAKQKNLWSPLFKYIATGLILLAQLPCVVFSTFVDNQRDLSAGFVEKRNAISHPVNQHLNKSSSTPSAITIILIPILVLASGLFAGLTIGYMSLDSTQLAVLAKSGTPSQKVLAQKVAPLRRNGHMLLITLLIANMIANETLPIVSEKALGGGVQAIIISTVLVIIFSEIIPQSVCATHALRIGAACAKPVQLLIYLFYPVVWPISSLLTKLLGDHSGMMYRPAELKELVNLHSRQSNHGGDLAADVVTIISSAIDLQERVVEESMTSLNNCFMLNVDTQLNYGTMSDILASGHSRIPVYEDVILPSGSSRKIVGALLTKQLILIDPEDGVLLREFPLNPLPHVASDMPLLHILNSFQEGRSHLAVVCPSINTLANVEVSKHALNEHAEKTSKSKSKSSWWWRTMFTKKAKPPQENLAEIQQADALTSQMAIQPSKGLLTDQPMGIISLEDVLEALLNEPIYDETDLDEHGHMAVPPYVPPEAFAALQKPNSYPIPSPMYDSKASSPCPPERSQESLQIETEATSTSVSTDAPHKSKNLSSNELIQAYEFESLRFSNLGVSCDLGPTESLSSMIHSGLTKEVTHVEIYEPSQIDLVKTVATTKLSKDLTLQDKNSSNVHLSTRTGARLTTDHGPLILDPFDNHRSELMSAILPNSHGQTSPFMSKELVSDTSSKNQSFLPPGDNLEAQSQTERTFRDGVNSQD